MHGHHHHVDENEGGCPTELHSRGSARHPFCVGDTGDDPPDQNVHQEDEPEDEEREHHYRELVGEVEAGDVEHALKLSASVPRLCCCRCRCHALCSNSVLDVFVFRTMSCWRDTGDSSSPADAASCFSAALSEPTVTDASPPIPSRCSTSRRPTKLSTAVRVPTTVVADPRTSSASS